MDYAIASYALLKLPERSLSAVIEILSNGSAHRVRPRCVASPGLVAAAVGVAFEATRKIEHLIQAFPEIIEYHRVADLIERSFPYSRLPKEHYTDAELDRIRLEISENFQDPVLN